MTTYFVDLSDQAQAEAEDAYFRFSARLGPDFASEWFDALRSAIKNKLSTMPQRFPLSEEGNLVYPGTQTRSMLFGEGRAVYRVLFHIIEPIEDETEGIVRVLRVRHAAMRPLGQPDDETA